MLVPIGTIMHRCLCLWLCPIVHYTLVTLPISRHLMGIVNHTNMTITMSRCFLIFILQMCAADHVLYFQHLSRAFLLRTTKCEEYEGNVAEHKAHHGMHGI